MHQRFTRQKIILQVLTLLAFWCFGASFLAGRNGGAGAKRGILGRDRMEGFVGGQ